MTIHIKTLALAAAFAAAAFVGSAKAAIITYVGFQNNVDSTADDGPTIGWHSTLNAKPLDIDGDNALGSEGWIRANNGASGRSNPRRFLPGYVVPYAADGQTTVIPTFANSGSGVMDNPATGGLNLTPATEDANASWHQGGTTNLNIFQFTIQNAATLTGRTLRVGVLFDAANLAPGVGATQAMAITQTVGGAAFDTSPQLAYGNNGLDVAYFDLTGLVNGDRFVISADANGTNARSHIAGITFDSAVVVPEPSTLALLAAGGLAAIGFLRRKR